MKSKLPKILGIAVVLALALSAVGSVVTPDNESNLAADPGLTKWTKVSTPVINDTDWKIRQDSTINSFDMGPDGKTIYAVGDVGGTDYLWKSTNHGATWSNKTSKIQTTDEPKADGLAEFFTSFDLVSVAPEDSDFVAVAGMLTTTNKPGVVFSNDGAAKFHYLGDLPAAVDKIYSLDVSTEVSDNHFVAVGTDKGVFITEVPGYAGWIEASAKTGWLAGQVAVTSVAFSPIFDDDETILAISTNSTGTWLQSGRWGTTKAWNAAAGDPFPAAVKITKDITETTAIYVTNPFDCTGIAIPSDYDGFTSALRKVFVYANVANTPENITGAKGCLYRIDSSKIYPCPGRLYGFCPDVEGTDLFASIAYHGTGIDGKFMLGQKPKDHTACCAGVQVWRAEDIDFCCPEWSGASKKPTGQLRALVAFTPDGKKGYCGTKDAAKCKESAFSVSWDDGKCWNQLSLIDTEIDYLSDVAVNGECNTTLLFSVNNSLGCYCDSVWFKADDLEEASEYSGVWLREWCGLLTADAEFNGTDTPEIGLIRLAPEETGRVFTVYLVDRGTDTVLYNASSGLTAWLDRHCTRISVITDLAVESESIIYALGDDDMVSSSTNNGKKWAKEVDTEVTDGHTIAALADGNVLVGSSSAGNRKVAYSSDGAATFSRTAKLPTATDNVHVAFDTYFEDNDTIYAAADGSTGGIYRWVIDVSADWDDLAATPTLTQMGGTGTTKLDVSYYGIVTELSGAGNPLTDAKHGGVLYAAYTYVTGSNYYAGVARCLTPAETACCDIENWDYLHAKLSVGETDSQRFTLEPSSLRICGCLTKATNSNLWAIDNQAYGDGSGAAGRLWTYEDCFAKEAPKLTAVADGATVAADPCECWAKDFTLKWDRLCNACKYDIQISLDKGFTEVIAAVSESDYSPPDGASPSIVVDGTELSCATTYYWRVRASEAETDEAIHSFWSSVRSFTVAQGPLAAIKLTAPEDGAPNVAIEGVVFTWTTVADATSYDFALMDAAGKTVESKTGLTVTSYVLAGKLAYDTAYTWKVTALKDGNVISESSLSTFRTAPAAVWTCAQCGLTFPSEAALKAHLAAAHPPVVPVTPTWVWVVIGIGAVLVITVIVLIFRTRRV